ncbi:neuropeptides capa receptor, partial [Biomphalaria glabrata]
GHWGYYCLCRLRAVSEGGAPHEGETCHDNADGCGGEHFNLLGGFHRLCHSAQTDLFMWIQIIGRILIEPLPMSTKQGGVHVHLLSSQCVVGPQPHYAAVAVIAGVYCRPDNETEVQFSMDKTGFEPTVSRKESGELQAKKRHSHACNNVWYLCRLLDSTFGLELDGWTS